MQDPLFAFWQEKGLTDGNEEELVQNYKCFLAYINHSQKILFNTRVTLSRVSGCPLKAKSGDTESVPVVPV